MSERFCGIYPRTNQFLFTNSSPANKVYTIQLSDGVALGNPLNDAKYTLSYPQYILRITPTNDALRMTFDNNAELVTCFYDDDELC